MATATSPADMAAGSAAAAPDPAPAPASSHQRSSQEQKQERPEARCFDDEKKSEAGYHRDENRLGEKDQQIRWLGEIVKTLMSEVKNTGKLTPSDVERLEEMLDKAQNGDDGGPAGNHEARWVERNRREDRCREDSASSSAPPARQEEDAAVEEEEEDVDLIPQAVDLSNEGRGWEYPMSKREKSDRLVKTLVMENSLSDQENSSLRKEKKDLQEQNLRKVAEVSHFSNRMKETAIWLSDTLHGARHQTPRAGQTQPTSEDVWADEEETIIQRVKGVFWDFFTNEPPPAHLLRPASQILRRPER